MYKQTAKTVMTVVIFTVIGAGILLAVMALLSRSGFQLIKRTEDAYYKEMTFSAPAGDVTEIIVTEAERRVVVQTGEGGDIEIVHYSKKRDHYDTELKDGIMTVTRVDEIGENSAMDKFVDKVAGTEEEEVYDLVISLPSAYSGALQITTTSGDIVIRSATGVTATGDTADFTDPVSGVRYLLATADGTISFG